MILQVKLKFQFNHNRVLIIEDNERPFDFYLHIFVQHNEPPQYQDLVERIKHHSKVFKYILLAQIACILIST
jgi:hypothetical protein